MKLADCYYFLTSCTSVRKGFSTSERVLHVSLRTFSLVIYGCGLKGLSVHSPGYRPGEMSYAPIRPEGAKAYLFNVMKCKSIQFVGYCILLPRWGVCPPFRATQGVALSYVDIGLSARMGELFYILHHRFPVNETSRMLLFFNFLLF